MPSKFEPDFLVALADYDRHGYSIMQDIAAHRRPDPAGGGSYLVPEFAKAFPALVKESGHKDTWSTRGFGQDNADFPATILPEVHLELSKDCCAMRPAPIVQVPGAWGHGMIGFNVLKNARAVTLDFRRMRWTVE